MRVQTPKVNMDKDKSFEKAWRKAWSNKTMRCWWHSEEDIHCSRYDGSETKVLNGVTLKVTWFFCWCRNQFSISKSPKQHHDMTQILSNGKQDNLPIDLIIEVLCEIILMDFKNKCTFVAHYFRAIRINISPGIPRRILKF